MRSILISYDTKSHILVSISAPFAVIRMVSSWKAHKELNLNLSLLAGLNASLSIVLRQLRESISPALSLCLLAGIGSSSSEFVKHCV